MRISKRFKLGKSQAELDFVDIDTTRDNGLYLDPHLISVSTHAFAIKCHTSLEGFFSHFLQLMRIGNHDEARSLFSHLHEPNETCFGESKGKPSGRGIGSKQATQLFESIKNSRAVATGVLEHLEDCAIFVPGIDRDKVSDMTTNIVRHQLLAYTQQQAELHGIPLRDGTPIGPLWDNANRRWYHIHDRALVIEDRPILLVPKSIVSFAKNYSLSKYHTHFVLNYIKREQFRTNGPFVRRKQLKRGGERVWVSKAELKNEIAPAEKNFVTGFTLQHAAVFTEFQTWAKEKARPMTPNELRSSEDVSDIADYLADQLRKTMPGNESASAYHRLIVGILELVFYPSLTCPVKEKEIHDGRKRIDICFDNSAQGGFFWSLHQVRKIPSQYVMIECKNYGREIGNPELDQLSGRFSVNRGQIGMLVCRSVEDYERLMKRCQDTYKDGRGLVLPILDDDLLNMLKEKAADPKSRPEEAFLNNLTRNIILA